MKILVAEDEPQLLRVLTVAMQKAGYEVDPVDNGLKAVEHTKERCHYLGYYDAGNGWNYRFKKN